MHLDTIKLFCDVVRLRSISRGAAANGVTQSGASQAIQQLEAELDAQLLDRSRRPLQPTAEGRGFHDACRTLLQGFARRCSRWRRQWRWIRRSERHARCDFEAGKRLEPRQARGRVHGPSRVSS